MHAIAKNNRCKQTGLFYRTTQNLVVTKVLSYSFAFFFLFLHLFSILQRRRLGRIQQFVFSTDLSTRRSPRFTKHANLSDKHSYHESLARQIGQALPVLLLPFTSLFFSPFLRFCASSLSIVTVLQTLRTKQNLIT